MVVAPRTLVITTHRNDIVQGEIGEGVASLLQEPVDTAQFDELEFILSDSATVLWRGIDISNYNKIIMYGGVGRILRIAHPLALIVRAMGVEAHTSSAENYLGLDKLSQMVQFSLNQFKIPKTYFGSPQNLVKNAPSHFGFPFILKDILSSLGERNYLITSQPELEALLAEMEQDRYIAQEYIENDGDIRVLINCHGDSFSFKRSAPKGSHINNTSAGGEATEYAAPQSLLDECARLLEVRKLEISGIDVIQNGNEFYFLEANLQPMIFTGAFTVEKQKILRNVLRTKWLKNG